MISGYQYRVNELGQRTDVTQTGSVFAAGQGIAWGYDALGQVTSADHTTQNTQDRAYRYDTIGNRVEAREAITAVTGTPNYTANALNQYTAVGNRAPTHDDDGNLRLDGGVNKDNEPREYVWDAENRLISVKRFSDGAPIVTYQYDSQSRRISRSEGVSSAPSTAYLYDAWNCIAEYSIQNSAFTLQHSRLWGLDLSGALQGAGGVGGLLCESQISTTQITNYYPTYDGNGNISEYLAQTGTPAARFEYDPFGNTVVNTDATNQFAYRFSTKPADAATGLYYYGYRYYDPVTGRWPSRDPIEEEGGVNLYGFVGNDGVNRWDYLGLVSEKCIASSLAAIDQGIKLLQELRKYDPIEDAKGGHKHRFGVTKPGGHYIEIKQLQRGLKIKLKKALQDCDDNDDPPKKRPMPYKQLDQMANLPVQVPNGIQAIDINDVGGIRPFNSDEVVIMAVAGAAMQTVRAVKALKEPAKKCIDIIWDMVPAN